MKIHTIRLPGERNNTYRIYPIKGYVDFWYNPSIGFWEIRVFDDKAICQKSDERKNQKEARTLALAWAGLQS